jgi:hypothetical protein
VLATATIEPGKIVVRALENLFSSRPSVGSEDVLDHPGVEDSVG